MEANMAKFSEKLAELLELANAWFGPEEQALPRSQMAHDMIYAGIHGHRPNELKHYLQEGFDSTRRHPKGAYLLHRFLGTDGQLRKKYPVLERYWILYPVCWLHRSCRALQPKRFKRISKEFKAVMKRK